MHSATGQKITAELARMRMWRRLGDEGEAELCNDRINNLLDRLVAGTTPLTAVDCGEVNGHCVDTQSTSLCVDSGYASTSSTPTASP
jgi:hypothetical protein